MGDKRDNIFTKSCIVAACLKTLIFSMTLVNFVGGLLFLVVGLWMQSMDLKDADELGDLYSDLMCEAVCTVIMSIWAFPNLYNTTPKIMYNMPPVRNEQCFSPTRAIRSTTAYPIPRRLIRKIAHHVASSGRALLRLEVSGQVIDNFDDIYTLSEDEEHDLEMTLPPAACGGNEGNLPVPCNDDDLTSLSWLQDRNLLKGINLSKNQDVDTQEDEVDEEYDEEIPAMDIVVNAPEVESTSPALEVGPVESPPFSDPPPSPVSSPEPSSPPIGPFNPYAKPPYPFAYLIFMAIDSSREGALRVKEIYAWIIKNFPYYKDAPQGWKNSVRHNLSLNKWFHKVESSQLVGRGCLWTFFPQCRQILQMQANARRDSPEMMLPRKRGPRIVPRPRGTDSPSEGGAEPSCSMQSDDPPPAPGVDEYLAAAGVLAMKYGTTVMDQLSKKHLEATRHALEEHSYSGCEERKTAEALLSLAGVSSDDTS